MFDTYRVDEYISIRGIVRHLVLWELKLNIISLSLFQTDLWSYNVMSRGCNIKRDIQA